MQNYLRKRREAGFTLIELLIVIAIIGIIATILIPELLDALQKAKQKQSVGEMDSVGTAMFAWVTDEAGAAAAGAPGVPTWDPGDYAQADTDYDLIVAELSAEPDSTKGIVQYIQTVPTNDGWGRLYNYWLDIDNPLAENVAAIHSCGRQEVSDDSACPPPAGEVDPAGPFNSTCYRHDLIWADGDFVAYPAGRQGWEAFATENGLALDLCDLGSD